MIEFKLNRYVKRCVLMLLFTLLHQSCVKTLTDEDDFILQDGGKELQIHLNSGVSLKNATTSIHMNKVKKMTITGVLGGHSLAFLRGLAGGDNSNYLAECNLGELNIEMCLFTSGEEVYYNRNGVDLKISALSGSTGIPPYAFENCYSLNTVVLPRNTHKIGKGAFKDCLLLRYILWGKKVKNIEEDAFNGCSTLALGEPLILPEGLEYISDRAFMETILSSVELPSTIEYIGENAFSPIFNNVVIRATNPPVIKETSFVFDKTSDKVLYVPMESVENYKIEPYLSIFNEIKSIE